MTSLIARRSEEHLSHFVCGDPACGQWWSIGDFGAATGWPQATTIICPRCGRPQAVAPWLSGETFEDFPA
jgi:predicted RNA-binding Zn-ribbon protein involved in translation (DUF1610 family)